MSVPSVTAACVLVGAVMPAPPWAIGGQRTHVVDSRGSRLDEDVLVEELKRPARVPARPERWGPTGSRLSGAGASCGPGVGIDWHGHGAVRGAGRLVAKVTGGCGADIGRCDDEAGEEQAQAEPADGRQVFAQHDDGDERGHCGLKKRDRGCGARRDSGQSTPEEDVTK